MTDLRTRIYDIVWRELAYEGDDFCGHLADVLIRELDIEGMELHKEFSIGDDEDGRVLWLAGEEPVTPREGEIVECRWISEWVPASGEGDDD